MSLRTGAKQLLERNHGLSHGVAEDNRPRRKPGEQRKRVISPGGAIDSSFPNGLAFAATRLPTFDALPTADAVGYALSLLRSYLPPLSKLICARF